jgi:dihydroorotase
MILFKNARIFDGKSLADGIGEVLVSDGRIEQIGTEIASPEAETVDLGGKILSPGFIDLHCHMRDPGFEWREDIESASRAAARGGFTTAVAMPNTDPAIDNDALVRYVIEKGRKAGFSRILPAGTVSKKREGKELAEMGKMASAGCVLFTDDGSPVASSRLFRTALLYSRDLGVRIMEHPEELSISKGGHVNEGRCSSLSGLKGIPASSEEIGVFRALSLSRETGVPVHVTHLSTRKAIALVREAKSENLPVTCDVTPHHLCLSEELVLESGFDSCFKVNPPLRSQVDIESLWEALSDGTVDAIATDHAPWHMDEKDLPFPEAPFGIASLECAFAALCDAWRKRGKPITLARLLALLTSGPASVLPEAWNSLGTLRPGARADLVVVDTELVAQVSVSGWKSKARLTPWEGSTLTGWPVMSFVDGRLVFDRSRE